MPANFPCWSISGGLAPCATVDPSCHVLNNSAHRECLWFGGSRPRTSWVGRQNASWGNDIEIMSLPPSWFVALSAAWLKGRASSLRVFKSGSTDSDYLDKRNCFCTVNYGQPLLSGWNRISPNHFHFQSAQSTTHGQQRPHTWRTDAAWHGRL